MADPPRTTRRTLNNRHSQHTQGSNEPPVSQLLEPSSNNRVTRSSAKLATETDNVETERTSLDRNPPTPTPSTNKKRKAVPQTSSSPTSNEEQDSLPTVPSRRSKRRKTASTPFTPASPPSTKSTRSIRKHEDQDTTMSGNGYGEDLDGNSHELTATRSSSKQSDEFAKQSTQKPSSRTHSSRGSKKSPTESSPPAQPSTTRKLRKKPPRKNTDPESKDNEKSKPQRSDVVTPPPPPLRSDSSEMSPDGADATTAAERDPFSAALFGRGGPSGLSSTLRALSGMMSGMTSRFRDILANLKRFDDPTMQMIALEELSNLLLVSNEDDLSGQFAPDPYIKELVLLMQPNPITMEENPEIMLLACRCLANLMEAMRGSSANVMYGGAIPILCQKLLDIQFIDVAEQALSTLAKISTDFPAAIVREGGLSACLQFLDFFATGTQRVAVTTAANCCRNIPHDSFNVIRDVMPILQNVLSSHDQKVVEQGSLCVTRIIDSFKHSSDKLEQLVDSPLLKAILGLLAPGTTNLIGANIHTEFLRVLAIVARNSPKLSAELLKLNVVDTLYQILTGTSPPVETDNAASSIDSVVIMQALIHRPRDQIYEALNVIVELLPRVKTTSKMDPELKDLLEYGTSDSDRFGRERPDRHELRQQLLRDCGPQTRRFAMVLLPTLTDAYSSTVTLSVRQKVLIAQLKILSNLDTKVIEDALRPVPYASFLASILTQEDHSSLVIFALQASELLFDRLESIYRYQFYREGVIGEIVKIASRHVEIDTKPHKLSLTADARGVADGGLNSEKVDATDVEPVLEGDEDDVGDDEEEGLEDHGEEIIVEGDIDIDDEHSDSSDEDGSQPLTIPGVKDLVIVRAKDFLSRYDNADSNDARVEAGKIQETLRNLAQSIRTFYTSNSDDLTGTNLFKDLAGYFDGDAIESITSSELLDSGIVRLLADIITPQAEHFEQARNDFISAFMGNTNSSKTKTVSAGFTTSPFTVLVNKLHDLLSRSEHFEVLTVNSSASESSRSTSTSMLSRQIRLKLSADADSEIPLAYRDMIVSIHAIATFKALDDYLRPRISLAERPISGRRRDMFQQLANARMAQLSGAADSGLFSAFGTDLRSLSGAGSPSSPSRPESRLKSQSIAQPPENQVEEDKSRRRRSSRRLQKQTHSKSPPTVPSEPANEGHSHLEVADEKPVGDTEEPDDMSGIDQIDAIMGELEEASDDDDNEPDPVNMEIASSGRVTARREDGSRVYTPSQPSTPVGAGKPEPTPNSIGDTSLTGTKRPSTYAQAAAAPQDWHIEFSIDGKPVPDNITIYRAVHHNRESIVEANGRNIWTGVHEVKFRRAQGAAQETKLSTSAQELHPRIKDGLPTSLDGHPITSSILTLLRILHQLNAGLDDDHGDNRRTTGLRIEPATSFINTKLTAKMNRQLEEPLIIASNCLPDWSEDLARSFPFLFPFETRHLFLQSTSFGYSRSITRWQNSQSDSDDRQSRRRDDRPIMGRPQRQKVRIARPKMLESGMKVMDHFGSSPSILEVEYFDEVGTGLGPTLEFYSIVSKEFAKKSLKLWRENDTAGDSQYAFGKNGLFPAPMSEDDKNTEKGKKILYAFRMLGVFVARSMLDSRIIDINFNSTFFKVDDVDFVPSIALLRTIDADLASSMAQLQAYADKKARIEADSKMMASQREIAISNLTITGASIEDLCLDFTMPGYPDISLVEGGSDISVTADNINEYISKVLEISLKSGINAQVEAFQSGFSQVFSYASLKAFTPNELVMLFGRVDEDWSLETLMDSIKADHGFNMDSSSIKNLLNVMSNFTIVERRDFLQFVTGSPRLPIGGFKALTPMFTIVCKPSEPPYTSDDYLPSVMTCANYLKLPDYTNIETLRHKLGVAVSEGQSAFHLS